MTIIKPSGKPTCPNHGCPLDGLGFPMPAKGIGICPVSGASFEYEIDLEESKMQNVQDKDGNITKAPSWKMKGEEK